MTLAERRRAGRLLLALLGGCPVERDVPAHTWALAALLAREQRLAPHCHGALTRRSDVCAPMPVLHEWRAAHRRNGLALLAHRRALASACAVLHEAGIAAVALKGAALAWTVWPVPAERVMRDLDLLVAPGEALHAYRLLRRAGWEGPDPAEALLERMAHHETHLPPLLSPDGVILEVHGHVWRSPPLPGGAMPASDSAAVMARARLDPRVGARVPAHNDMLAHLVVHGAHAHLFNVGPLLLADADYLVRSGEIDWPAFWQQAQRDGFARAAALVLGLTQRWRQPGLLARSACPVVPPERHLDQAEALLFQAPDARKEINLIAGLFAAPKRAHRRLAPHPLDRSQGREGFALARLARRGAALAHGLVRATTRRDGLDAGRLARWLAD